MNYILDRSRLTAISIVKIQENADTVYCVVVVPSYLTRASKISINHFQRYSTLDEAINVIRKQLSTDNLYSKEHLVSDNCVPFLQYDPDKIKIIKFTNAETDKLQSNNIITV